MSEQFARLCSGIWPDSGLAPTCSHGETEEPMAVTTFNYSSVDDLLQVFNKVLLNCLHFLDCRIAYQTLTRITATSYPF